MGPCRHRQHRPLQLHDRPAGRHRAGAAPVHRDDGVRAWPAEPPLHAGLPSGRRGVRRRRPAPRVTARSPAPYPRRRGGWRRAALRRAAPGRGRDRLPPLPRPRAVTDLFWPGDERASSLMTGEALLSAMVEVEEAWLAVLAGAGIAPAAAAQDLSGVVDPAADLRGIAAAAEGGGNPVIPLVGLLRERLGDRNAEAARWLHRGLTSQDVMDTALTLCARAAADRVLVETRRQVVALRGLAERHRSTLQPGRTLTQLGVPTTFGLTATTWLSGILGAAEELAGVLDSLPVQVGGAAGTLSAVTELARGAGSGDPAGTALALAHDLAGRLDL